MPLTEDGGYGLAYTDLRGDYPPMPRNYVGEPFVQQSKSAQAKLARIRAALTRLPGRTAIPTDEVSAILDDAPRPQPNPSKGRP